MNTDQFAQQIKQKYPQYQDMDNLELSKKIIEKYPQYKSSVVLPKEEGYISRVADQYGKAKQDIQSAVEVGAEQMQKPGILGKITGAIKSGLGTAGGFARAAFAPITEAPVIKQGVEAVGTAIAPTIQKGLETDTGKKLLVFQQQYPEAFKSLQDVIDVSTLGFGKAVEKPIQAGIEQGVKTVGEIASKVPNVGVKGLGEKLYKSAIDYTADEAKLVQDNIIKKDFLKKQLSKATKGTDEYKALQGQLEIANKYTPTTRVDTALQKGIAGTQSMVGRQAGVEKLGLWKNNIEPALKNSRDVLTKDELFAKAKQTVDAEVEPGRKQALQDAYDALQEDYKNFADTDLLTASKIKTSLDKFTPTKIFKGMDVASEYKTLKADLANSIREKVYNSLKDVNIKKAYRDYANLQELEKVGIKALTDGGLKGGFGGFWSTIYDIAATPIKTVGGQVLYRVGDKLEFIGKKGLKNIGDYLKSKNIKVKPKGTSAGLLTGTLSGLMNDKNVK